MKEYNAHFSCYSEQHGSFTEVTIKVNAENQFDARYKAWELSGTNDDLKFSSCIELCGITWKAAPLDLQDYFNAQAEYEKYRIRCIEKVGKLNAQINKTWN